MAQIRAALSHVTRYVTYIYSLRGLGAYTAPRTYTKIIEAR